MPKKRSGRDGLYQRSGSPYWWGSFTNRSGQRIRKSTGCEEKRDAQNTLARWRLDAATIPNHDTLTFDHVLAQYLSDTEAKASHSRDLISAKNLFPAFSGMRMEAITKDAIRRYIVSRKVAIGTTNKEVGLLSVAINHYNMMHDATLPNPAQGMRQREPEGRLRWLTKEEAASLISATRLERQSPHLTDFVVLALNTGCRKTELLGLECNRVDFATGLIMLEADHTKSSKRRYIPMNETVIKIMQSRQGNGRWVFPGKGGNHIMDVKRSFRTACNRANITGFHIHDLRHTFAAWLVTGGTPLPVVRDLLGHSTIAMTERYAHLSPDTLRTAVNSLAQCDENVTKAGTV